MSKGHREDLGERLLAEYKRVADKYFAKVVAAEGKAVFRRRETLSGSASVLSCGGRQGFVCIEAPDPTSIRALYVFLHECGHILLGHMVNGNVPGYAREMEAEAWTHITMQTEGLPIPPAERQRAAQYVGDLIGEALASTDEQDREQAADYLVGLKSLKSIKSGDNLPWLERLRQLGRKFQRTEVAPDQGGVPDPPQYAEGRGTL